MGSTINQRIDELIKQMRTNPKAFAESIEKTPTTIYTVLSGRNKPGYEVIESILKKYPNVNPDWLLMGEGEMFRDSSTTPTQASVAAENSYLLEHLRQLESSFNRLSSQLEKKDEQIAGLQRTVEVLLGKCDGVPSSQIVPQGIRTAPLQITLGCEVGRVFKKQVS